MNAVSIAAGSATLCSNVFVGSLHRHDCFPAVAVSVPAVMPLFRLCNYEDDDDDEVTILIIVMILIMLSVIAQYYQ